jgi:two-component system, sensor histidine kinase
MQAVDRFVSMGQTATGTPALGADEGGAPSVVDAIRREQIAVLFKNITVGVLGAFAGALVLSMALVYTDSTSSQLAMLWISGGVICVAAHLFLTYLYQRAPEAAQAWRPWANWFTAICFAEGIWWGVATLFLADFNDFDGQILTLLAASAVIAGAVPALSSYLPAFYAIFFPALVPFAARGFFQGGVTYSALALGVVVFICTIWSLAYNANARLVAVLRLNFEKDALADRLRQEIARAEEANRAKSRFLAAASHDLRQPVHALGMFLGVLSRHPMDVEMRRLVEQMERSVEALGSLFTSLLDMSRIDVGVIAHHPQAFALEPLLRRICDDYEAEAKAKGNRLILGACTHAVYTDPLLLERILRNVISNAVRYTDHGRILSGCRLGKRLRIEIHDTGRGIPLDQQERVFEEFYQLENPERDRSKGLGLGLAIVKRLALILGCPFELRSRPGKGTVFKLSVARADRPGPPPTQARERWSGAERSGLILVIDDEASVRGAMRSLLSSWGHQVIAAGSCAEMLQKISGRGIHADLIICDYRLRGNENGFDVIRRLRSVCREEIPAMLLTGDTSPDRLAEVAASGLPLLHKPVVNAKLRAAIRHLMNTPARS